MAIGLGVLGLTPDAFWLATPKEIDAMLRGRFGMPGVHDALSKNELSQLMQQFPD